jgi:hypothetical protein
MGRNLWYLKDSWDFMGIDDDFTDLGEKKNIMRLNRDLAASLRICRMGAPSYKLVYNPI